MASAAEDRSWISPEEYYRIERDAVEKSDWYRGEMFNMAGGTTNRSRIKTNLLAALALSLKGKPCEPLDSDQRVKSVATGLRFYPDASVFCERIAYDDEDPFKETAINPGAVFEVLSDSTEAYDRGLRAECLRRIESLRAYAFLSQHAPHVELYERQDDGSWRFSEVSGPGGEVEIRSIDVVLSLAEIYDRVEFRDAE
ncbi:MAG: Uma2 family endonuclease [Verrucomicrobiae bacterium]|nr:Uma2 family endonuclease [Verrucomicrobiae bacterium]MCP5539840.1 Uma2 family endonuclease [Akkermansiaceae bacterium]MCP5551937.1 Uma2 family endonuclease [Akkermansiaceae bacterium]